LYSSIEAVVIQYGTTPLNGLAFLVISFEPRRRVDFLGSLPPTLPPPPPPPPLAFLGICFELRRRVDFLQRLSRFSSEGLAELAGRDSRDVTSISRHHRLAFRVNSPIVDLNGAFGTVVLALSRGLRVAVVL